MMRDQALSQQDSGAIRGSHWLSLLLAVAVFILAPHARGADRQNPNAPVPNACSVLSNDDLTGLLLDQAGGALDSWSNRTDAGLSD